MATGTPRPLTYDSSVRGSMIQVYKTVGASESAPTMLDDSAGDFEDYLWLIFDCHIIQDSGSPQYRVRGYYWNPITKKYSADEITEIQIVNKMIAIQTFGRRIALRVESLVNITELQITAQGWNFDPRNILGL